MYYLSLIVLLTVSRCLHAWYFLHAALPSVSTRFQERILIFIKHLIGRCISIIVPTYLPHCVHKSALRWAAFAVYIRLIPQLLLLLLQSVILLFCRCVNWLLVNSLCTNDIFHSFAHLLTHILWWFLEIVMLGYCLWCLYNRLVQIIVRRRLAILLIVWFINVLLICRVCCEVLQALICLLRVLRAIS
jgi:hypothetical protein